MSRKEDFLKYQAQTTPFPLLLDIEKAEGCWIYDKSGKKYLDLVAGVSANVLGHSNPKITKAIKDQVDKYMHVMVYGEFIQDAPLELTKLLSDNLPEPLDTVYLVNSGTEAIEGSMKLAKRVTGRSEIIAAKWAYHGNTQGSMSILGNEEQKQKFRPLIPNINFIEFNNIDDLNLITEKTAAVVLETIQGGAGFILPKNNYLKKVRERCDEVGALLILDEIQPGFGRTGKLFGFMNFDIVPDILAIGKAMGGGMPVGAFVASKDKMALLKSEPMLGHITTFGGHPVIAASSLATLKELLEGNYMEEALWKEKLFREHLNHPAIKEIRGMGLMLAPVFDDPEFPARLMSKLMEKGLITFLLLFEKRALRISPPLTISDDEILYACNVINETIEEMI
ncbi:MAG: aminotransferase class III-fold pyridoxal phosphate-dependent enzyme [Bacteroidota bacterium]